LTFWYNYDSIRVSWEKEENTMTVSKLIAVVIGLVVGLSLLPVVYTFVTDLTGEGGDLEGTAAGALVDLLPILYVIILVAGAVAYVTFSRKG